MADINPFLSDLGAVAAGTKFIAKEGATSVGYHTIEQIFAGGAGSTTQLTLLVSSVALNYAEIVVADLSVTAVSKLSAELVPELDAENDLESLADANMRLWAVPEAGQIKFVLTALGAFVGPFKVNYKVTA